MLNAIQAFGNNSNPEIKLTANYDQWGKVNISVTDNGCGIPEDLY
jgi:C4-dicarboxylate-specific signal transduction histidine kinase